MLANRSSTAVRGVGGLSVADALCSDCLAPEPEGEALFDLHKPADSRIERGHSSNVGPGSSNWSSLARIADTAADGSSATNSLESQVPL